MLLEYYSDLKTPVRRNKIIKINDLQNYINPEIDCYRSLFCYNNEILEHINKTGTISGFKGDAFADFLVFDFDSDSNIEDSLKEVKALISKLINNYGILIDEIRVSFSGNKGFSLEISTEGLYYFDQYKPDIPNIEKGVCLKLAEGLNTVDKVIYQHNRLFRLTGTKHQISGLYKNNIPLLMLKESIDNIKKYCESIQKSIPIKKVSNPEKLNILIKDIVDNGIKYNSVESFEAIDIDLSNIPKCPYKEKYCIHMLKQGIETEQRHNSLMRIAVHERQKGYGPNSIKGTLEDVLDRMDYNNPEKAAKDPFDPIQLQRIVTDAFKKIELEGQEIYQYSFGCNCELLMKYCSPECYLQKSKKVSSKKLYKIAKLSSSYSNFMANYDKNIISSGLKTLEDAKVNFFRGTMNLIVGRSGCGKTNMLLNILRNSNKQGIPSVFFSLDMPRDMMFQRMLTFCSPYILEQIQEIYKNKDKDKIQAIKDKYLLPSFKHTYFNFESKISLAEVSDYVKLVENETNKKVGFVVIDYASKLWSDFKSEYDKESHNAQWARDVAADLDVCLLIIAQTSRHTGGDGVTPMGNGSAKGSGVWESEATVQINTFRPFRLSENYDDSIMGVEVAKNRFGPECIKYLYWNGAKATVRDFTPHEYEDFLAVKEYFPRRKKYSYGEE